MKDQGSLIGDMESASGEKMDVDLPLIIFEEDGSQIFYCPALDLAGYGETEIIAYESFKIVMAEYFDFTTKQKTLKEDLIRMGWKIRKTLKKKMQAPSISSLLETNDNFKRIFDSHPFRKTDARIQIPAFA